MGGVVSTGNNNDHLIDNLLEADYIKTSLIERVFRAVDRAEYFLPDGRQNAYRDLAWKSGNLHISAPCIYSEVMEGLRLEPGLSFLNLGSGTGYLSTMAGLILGTYGINHGIEYYSDVVQYANKKLEDFKKFSGALDEFDFCEPRFMQGNCLCLTSDYHAQYDRVYCGAACPRQYESYMRNLLKVGGILVMPLEENLLQIRRVSENNWKVRSMLPVSFASLIEPPEGPCEWVQAIEVEPLSLQSLCRSVIRSILRKNVEADLPPVKKRQPARKVPKKRNTLRRMVVPLFESDDSSDDDRYVRIGAGRNPGRNREDPTSQREDGLVNLFVGPFRQRRNHRVIGASPDRSRSENEENATESRMETEPVGAAEDTAKEAKGETQVETRAVIEHNPSTSKADGEQNGTATRDKKNGNQTVTENDLDSVNEIHVFVDVLNLLSRSQDSKEATEREENESTDSGHQETERQPTTTATAKRDAATSKKKREKFDSGLGDEIVSNQDPSDDDDEDAEEEEEDETRRARYRTLFWKCPAFEEASMSSDDEEQAEKRPKRSSSKSDGGEYSSLKCRRTDLGVRRLASDENHEEEEEEEEEEEAKVDNEMHMYESVYTEPMKAKIQELPLPPILKRYLNFYREF